MSTLSLWRALQKETPAYPRLDRDIEVDVAIVGAGITGITAAIQLVKAGKKVAILEALKVGGGTTGDSTGNLYVAVQPYYHKIKSKFDGRVVRAIAASRRFSINYIEAMVCEKGIECSFQRRPWYLYSTDAKNDSIVDKEVEILREVGESIDWVDAVPLPFKVGKAAKMEGQARFDPLKYIAALARDLADRGCLIFENTRFLESEEKGEHCRVSCEGGAVLASHLILATHIPKGFHLLQTLAIPYRSYAVAARLQGALPPNANFWDTSEPHHATSSHSSGTGDPDLLVVADSHHKTGQAPDNDHLRMFQRIEDYLYRNYEVASIEHRWSAQHYQSADGVPYIGLAGGGLKRSYLATGYFADGLAYGTVAGVVLSDLILGNRNPWAEIYDSTRFTPLASSGKFLKENTNTLVQYLKDLPRNVDAKHFSDIPPGEGKTTEVEGEKMAAYRDESGQLHVVSAVCTHLQCIVKWNNAERTWDCPCHGSRFSFDGRVLEGPAIHDLEKRRIP
ncbi:MAG TPA: FAD-dependent oxidoreductase [bacterium]|nr:FAD-dependent oxidoreductase [bacterium]